MGAGAAICRKDDCDNLTYDLFCYLHEDGSNGRAYSPGVERIERLGAGSYGSYEPLSIAKTGSGVAVQVWSETKKVFSDLQDEIAPAGIRDQVRAYAEGAATTTALRFAERERLEVDANRRDQKIEALTSEVITALVPTSDIVEQEDAEFISNSIPTDGLGGFSDYDDARAIISYGIRKEWELGQSGVYATSADGIPYDIPYENFLTVVYSNDITPHVETALRREASDFHNNVFIATQSRAANPNEVHPRNGIASRAETEPISSSYFDEAREWRERRAADAAAYAKASEDAERASAERIQQRQEAVETALGMIGNAARGIGRFYQNTDEFMNRTFKTRPEDIEARRVAENKRNRDIFFDMATRKAKNRGGYWNL